MRQALWYGLALLVLMYLALRSLRLLAGFYGGRCHARRRQQQWYVRGWLCWFDASLAVFFCCRQGQDPRHLGRYKPEGQFYARQLCISHCFPFVCRQAYDARHHGRYGREGHLCGILVMMQTPFPMVQAVQRIMETPQLLSDKVVDVFVVPWTLFLRALVSGSLLFC